LRLVCVSGKVNSGRGLEVMRRHQPTVFFGVPTLFARPDPDRRFGPDMAGR
jgi:hypothetical protein